MRTVVRLLHACMIVLVIVLALPSSPARARTQSPAARAFDRIASLLGDWEGTLPDGRTHRVNYRWTAGNSALVETWTLGPDRESLTIYHRDGEVLYATHYCPQQTFPRLRLVADENDTVRFLFEGGANLQSHDRYHQHAFWIRFTGEDTFERSETYVANGATPEQVAAAQEDAPVVFRRVTAKPGAK